MLIYLSLGWSLEISFTESCVFNTHFCSSFSTLRLISFTNRRKPTWFSCKEFTIVTLFLRNTEINLTKSTELLEMIRLPKTIYYLNKNKDLLTIIPSYCRRKRFRVSLSRHKHQVNLVLFSECELFSDTFAARSSSAF